MIADFGSEQKVGCTKFTGIDKRYFFGLCFRAKICLQLLFIIRLPPSLSVRYPRCLMLDSCMNPRPTSTYKMLKMLIAYVEQLLYVNSCVPLKTYLSTFRL
jgi:hypothetical protein